MAVGSARWATLTVVSPSERRVLDFLTGVLPPDAPALSPQTPLFGTGLLDSLALVHLLVWVEEQTRQPLDPRTFDLRAEWSVAADVAAFIDRRTSDSRTSS